VRSRALVIAGTYWDNSIRHQADAFVTPLINKAWPKQDVLEETRTDTSLREPARKLALDLANRYQEDPDDLNWESRKVVARPKQQLSAYRLALRRSERACQLVPNKGAYLSVLGMAQYRLALYADALKSLEQADQLNFADNGGSIPADLAFLAMTHRQLGQKEEAKKSFDRLREFMTKPEWGNDTEAQSFLQEASTFFGAQVTESRKSRSRWRLPRPCADVADAGSYLANRAQENSPLH
jgi:tetratricopeptide (TPR) repeat protein